MVLKCIFREETLNTRVTFYFLAKQLKTVIFHWRVSYFFISFQKPSSTADENRCPAVYSWLSETKMSFFGQECAHILGCKTICLTSVIVWVKNDPTPLVWFLYIGNNFGQTREWITLKNISFSLQSASSEIMDFV